MKEGEEKGLDYYLAHPEEADQTDSKLMAQLLAATADPAPATTDKVSEGDKEKDGKAEEEAKAKADADEKAKLDAQAKADADAKAAADAKEEEGAGVATKDGKHIIPFSVLEAERQKSAQAEADAVVARKEAAEAKVQLEEALKEKGVVVKTGDQPSTLADLDAAIAEVKDEAPWMVPALEKMRGLLAASETRAKEAEGAIAAIHQQQQADSNKELGDAIANNPAITLWISQGKEKPMLWADAIKFDNQLRENPEWAEKSTTDRLKKVAELVASVHGKAVLPPGYDPSSVEKQTPVVDATKAIDATKAKELADKALKDAPTAAVTLSDIPGGEAVDTDPMENIEKQSIAQLGSMLMNMNPQQVQAWLSKHT